MKKSILILSLILLSTTVAVAKGTTEDRVQALEDKWAQYEAAKLDQNAKVAEAIAQLDQLRAEITAIKGGEESQTLEMKQVNENTERHYRDLEMRINAMDSQIKVFQDQLNRTVASVNPKLAQEGKDFQKGLDLVQRAEYQPAITAFQQFLKQYPKSPQRDDAQFWVAECRYGMRDYTQAIKDYEKFVEQFPKSPHTAEAVLKQGDGFLNLQMKTEAKVFYKKVVQDYPKSEEATQASAKLASIEKTGTAPTAQPAVPALPPSPQQLPPAESKIKESSDF